MTPQEQANVWLARDQARRRGEADRLHDQYCRCRVCKPPLIGEASGRRFWRGVLHGLLLTLAGAMLLAGCLLRLW